MPTVDDLVISLTIKPTSDLGKLKKQIDALMSPTKGGGTLLKPAGGMIPRAMVDDIDWIKRKMIWLLPTNLPADRMGQQILSSTHIQLLRKDTVEYAKRVLKTPNLEKLLKELGASDLAQGQDKLVDIFEGWNLYLQQMADPKGKIPLKKMQQVNALIDRFIRELSQEGGDMKVTFTAIQKAIPEFQDQFEALLKFYGISHIATPDTMMSDMIKRYIDFFTQKVSLGGGAGERGFEDDQIKRIVGKVFPKGATEVSAQAIAELGKLIKTNDVVGDTMKRLSEFSEKYDYDFKDLKDIAEKDVKKDVRLQALAVVLADQLIRKKKASISIPLGLQRTVLKVLAEGSLQRNKKVQQAMMKITSAKLKKDEEAIKLATEEAEVVRKEELSAFTVAIGDFYDKVKPDIIYTNVKNELEKFRSFLGDDFVKRLEASNKVMFIDELKNVASKRDFREISEYERGFGAENMAVHAARIQENFRKRFQDINSSNLNVWKQLEKIEEVEEISDENLEKNLDQLTKTYPEMKIISDMSDLMANYLVTFGKRLGEEEELTEREKQFRSLSDELLEIGREAGLEGKDVSKTIKESEQWEKLQSFEMKSGAEVIILRELARVIGILNKQLNVVSEITKGITKTDMFKKTTTVDKTRTPNP